MFPSPFRRATVITILLLATVLLPPPPRLSAGVIYPTLPPGSEYQLLFVTSGGTDATSTNIADYNAFVTAQAALNPNLPAGVTWSAVGSTALVAAVDNAPNPPGVPVFNTAGIEVSSGTLGLYDSFNLLSPPCYDQFGLPRYGPVYTGSFWGGTSCPYPLGNGDAVEIGYETSDEIWLEVSTYGAAGLYPFYALSSPITVPVPEPSTFALLGAGFVALIAARFRRGHQERG